MKVGDLVLPVGPVLGSEFHEEQQVGIIVEVIDHVEIPPVCKVLWSTGVVDKEWTDELEVVK